MIFLSFGSPFLVPFSIVTQWCIFEWYLFSWYLSLVQCSSIGAIFLSGTFFWFLFLYKYTSDVFQSYYTLNFFVFRSDTLEWYSFSLFSLVPRFLFSKWNAKMFNFFNSSLTFQSCKITRSEVRLERSEWILISMGTRWKGWHLVSYGIDRTLCCFATRVYRQTGFLRLCY